MSLEARSKQKYYYRKRRVNGRVQSEYIARGPVAELFAAADQRAAAAHAAERAQLTALQAEFTRIERILDRREKLLKLLTHAHLILAGYHTHKGQWRKRREKTL